MRYDRKCYPTTKSGAEAEWTYTFPFGSIADPKPKLCEDKELFFEVKDTVNQQIYVYYELDNFY